jgi:hypothetical protein
MTTCMTDITSIYNVEDMGENIHIHIYVPMAGV